MAALLALSAIAGMVIAFWFSRIQAREPNTLLPVRDAAIQEMVTQLQGLSSDSAFLRDHVLAANPELQKIFESPSAPLKVAQAKILHPENQKIWIAPSLSYNIQLKDCTDCPLKISLSFEKAENSLELQWKIAFSTLDAKKTGALNPAKHTYAGKFDLRLARYEVKGESVRCLSGLAAKDFLFPHPELHCDLGEKIQ